MAGLHYTVLAICTNLTAKLQAEGGISIHSSVSKVLAFICVHPSEYTTRLIEKITFTLRSVMKLGVPRHHQFYLLAGDSAINFYNQLSYVNLRICSRIVIGIFGKKLKTV